MHLERLIAVLETVAAAGRPITAGDLQQATGLPRPTCYRLIQSLCAHRLLEGPEGGGYLIGERLVRMAMLGQSDADVSQAAASPLSDMAIETGEAVFLSRFRNNGVEIIHVEVPTDPARSFIHPGLGFRPMHACSCSKAIAAFAEPAFRDGILKKSLRAYTKYTCTSADALRSEFDTIRKRGYAECVEEIELGVSSVAAPVQIGSIGAIYSVGAIGPIRRFTKQKRASFGKDLMVLADKVSSTIQLSRSGALA